MGQLFSSINWHFGVLMLAGVPVLAGGPEIGMAVAHGNFMVDQFRVTDSATIFDGSTLETAKGSVTVQLVRGGRIVLGPYSRGTIHANDILLEGGQSEI